LPYICTQITTNKKTNIMKNLRTATANDFKVGTILITSEGYEFKLINKYQDGIWESKQVVHFENEANFYKVAI
jgi:hypothetical protein